MPGTGQAFILRTQRGGVGELQGSVKRGAAWQACMSQRALSCCVGNAQGVPKRGSQGGAERERMGLHSGYRAGVGDKEAGEGQGLGRDSGGQFGTR